MTTSENARQDFWSAVGEEFGEAVVPPIPFEEASSQACCEVVSDVFGAGFDAARAHALTDADLARLADAFAAYFDSGRPELERLRDAVRRLLTRWPPA